MASPRFARLEIWSNFVAASGTRLAAVPDVLALVDVHAVSGENQLTLGLPVGSAAYTSLAARRVLRTVFADDSFEEWRILKTTAERTAQGGLVGRVECGDPALALGDVTIYRTEGDGTHTHQFEGLGRTAAQHLSDFILPALTAEGYTWVAVGTIDDAAPIDLVYDFTSALAAVQYLAQSLGLEFQFRRNGTTQYLIDLRTRIGSSAAVRYTRAGRDLQRFLREIDSAPMATRVLPKGADEGGLRATMAEAEWRVASVPSGTEVTLDDPLGGDGPIGEDTQLDGLYLERPNGTRDLIASSLESTQKVLIPDTTGLSVGDLIKFRKTSGGEVLDYLESPAQKTVAGYGLATKVLDLPDIPGTVNRVSNPAMRVYTTGSNAPPDGWSIIPGCGLAASAVDKEMSAARWRVGGASARVAAAADGQGIETGWAPIAPSAAKPFAAGYASYWNDTAAGRVRVDVVLGKAAVAISSMSRATAGGITTVTVNTGSAHNVDVGARVELTGCTPDGYNGIYGVTAVVDSDTFELQRTDDPGAITVVGTSRRVWLYPDPTNARPQALSSAWLDLGFHGIDANVLGATVAKVRVMQDGSTATTIYVDAAQVTQSAEQRPFIEGSGPVRLWQAANLYRRDFAPPATRYELSLIDLARLDGTTWAYEDLVLGQTIIAVDPDVPGSPISTRLLDIRRNLLVDGEAAVGLSTRAPDITDALVRPFRNPRLPRDAGDPQTPLPEGYFSVPGSDPTQVQVRLSAVPPGGTLYYWVGDAVQSTPQPGVVTAGAPTASQWGVYGAVFLVQRAQTSDLLLSAYVQLADGTRSQVRSWRIDRDTAANVTSQLAQVTSPANGMRVSWTPDTDSVLVDVFTRRTASGGGTQWPTSDGTQAAALSSTYYRGRFHVQTTGGGWSATGAFQFGATQYADTTAYPWGNGDTFTVILVPHDRWGNPGTRVESSGTYAATPPGSITSFTATRTSDGTGCGGVLGAGFSLAYSCANVAAGTHDLRLSVSINGGAYATITTITDPTAGSPYTGYTAEHYVTGGKFDPTVTYRFKVELLDSLSAVIDTAISAPIRFVSSCEFEL